MSIREAKWNPADLYTDDDMYIGDSTSLLSEIELGPINDAIREGLNEALENDQSYEVRC